MKTFKRSFGIFLVLGLISTACGGSEDDAGEASTSASSSAVVATTAAPVATTAAPSASETAEEGAALPDLGGRTISVAIENAYLPYNYVDA